MQPPALDRRTSSVKWQREMKGLGGECGVEEEKSRRAEAEGGDCRRKSSLGGEGEKGGRVGRKCRREE